MSVPDVFGLHTWTDRIPDAHVRCIINNGKMLARPKHLRKQNWGFVASLFGVGSNHAISLCKRAGIDPDAQARLRA